MLCCGAGLLAAESHSSVCSQVDDLDGTAHYRSLGVDVKATAADIKRASWRRLPARLPLPPPLPSRSRFSSAPVAAPLVPHQAYRTLAKTHHPDKGGDPAVFAKLQAAYETLIDPRKRQASWGCRCQPPLPTCLLLRSPACSAEVLSR